MIFVSWWKDSKIRRVDAVKITIHVPKQPYGLHQAIGPLAMHAGGSIDGGYGGQVHEASLH